MNKIDTDKAYAALQIAQKEFDRVSQLVYKEAKKASDEIKPIYTYETKPDDSYNPILESIRITRTIANYDEYEAIKLEYGVLTHVLDQIVNSVAYFINSDRILCHSGGGYLILNDPMLITPQEWEQIKAGNIPNKFLR